MNESSSGATATAEIELIITRIFDAPRELVWRAWSEAERLAQWWGPKDFDLKVKHLDFSPGGTFHYCMEGVGGFTMWGKFTYVEISEPDRLAYISCFSNEAGETARAPFFDGKWPLEVSNLIVLSEENAQTKLTIRARPINANEIEMQTFVDTHSSMHEGFGGTFDKLDAYLAKNKSTFINDREIPCN